MKTPELITVPRSGPTKRARLAAFKKKHGIVTHCIPHCDRKDYPWSACLIARARKMGKAYGTTETSTIGECVAHVGRLMDEAGIIVTGEGELSAVLELCRKNGISALDI